MWSWFGGGAAQRKDTPKDAILGLRSHLDMLQKREKHLQNQIDEQQNIARKNANTNKNGRRLSGEKKGGPRMLTRASSGQGSLATQEDARTRSGPDDCADRDPRAANQLDRVGQHQQRDARGHGKGQPGDEADSRQADAGKGGRDNVCGAHVLRLARPRPWDSLG